MGLYEQPNSWQCGPFALKHGLLAHGIFAHEDRLAQSAGSTQEDGTDDGQLIATALEYGCVLQLRRLHTARAARRALTALLADHTPVLLCVDQWDHWVTAVGADDTHIVVLDSHYDTVVRVEPWGLFLRRVGYRHRAWSWGPRVTWYDLHPLRSRGETGLRLALTPDRARRFLAAPTALRTALDDYARQLAPFAARNGRRAGAFPLGPWLRARAPQLATTAPADTVAAWAFTAELFGVRCAAERLPEILQRLGQPPARHPARVAVRATGVRLPVAS